MDIDEDRITLLGSDPQMVHLEKHSLVDIMLDPFPHGGGISTADALWMGVPVIALVGRPSRGVSPLRTYAIGLPDLIAKTEMSISKSRCDLAKTPNGLSSYGHQCANKLRNRQSRIPNNTSPPSRYCIAIFGPGGAPISDIRRVSPPRPIYGW